MMCTLGMLTTWDSKCGIFEYSRYLAYELLDTVSDLKIFSNFGSTPTANVCGTNRLCVTPDCFGVSWWNEPLIFDIEKIYRNAVGLDIFHVQYHSSLYKHPEFMNLIQHLKGKVGKIVITLHDSSRHPDTNLDYFDSVIFHKMGILHEPTTANRWLLPYPIQDNRPTVFSFGMGRNNYPLIEQACQELGVNFDFHDSRQHGWLPAEELYQRMRCADAVILWYNEVPVIGASAAARTALSSYRPVITNNVNWFSDLDREIYTVVNNKISLKIALDKILNLGHIRENSFKSLARKHMEVYNEK